MNHLTRRRLAGAAAALAMAGRPALAQAEYPRRPVRVLVPFAAGGGQDEFARRFVPLLGGDIGRTAFIDNRPGGNSILATEAAARAAPDGYTILQQTNNLSANPALNRNLPYDTLRDLAPISLVARTPHVLVVRPNFPARNLAEFAVRARNSQGGLNYGSAGIGSTNHLGALMLSDAIGATMENVVYRGAAEFTNDLLGGRIDFVVVGSAQGSALVRSGQARALAVTAASRIPALPEVPSFKELSMNLEIYSWTGYLAPARIPPDVIATLVTAMQAACHSPANREQFSDHELIGSTPAEFAAFIATELAATANLLKGVAIP